MQLTTPRIQEFLNERHEAGLSPKTVKHLRVLIRAALNDAEEWGYIVRNPAKWADPPRVQKYRVEALTPAEAQAVLEAVQIGPSMETI